MYKINFFQRDRGDICKNMNQYGHGKGTTQGGFSQFSVVKAKYCYPLKTSISFLDAVLLEPMGTITINLLCKDQSAITILMNKLFKILTELVEKFLLVTKNRKFLDQFCEPLKELYFNKIF